MQPNDDAPDMVNHPPHYTSHPSGVECITVTEHMNFCVGNAVEYLWRAGSKGAPVEDLKKARWYIDLEIRRVSGAPEEPVCIICCRPGAAGRTCESGAPCVGADETAPADGVESLKLAYDMLCKREPTQREGDAFAQRHVNSEDNECFIPAGGWTGRRCRACGRWVWGGPTACEGCVRREERDEARDCGQDDVCVTPPGCQRHWEERARELAGERDESKRVAAQLATRVADLEAQLAEKTDALRMASDRLDAAERELEGNRLESRFQDTYRDTEYAKALGYSWCTAKVGIVEHARNIVQERDEAKLVAAKLAARVYELEGRVSADGDADNRIRNLLADVDARIARAVMAEREACISVCQKALDEGDTDSEFHRGWRRCAIQIGARLRSRPTPAEWTPPCDVCRAQAERERTRCERRCKHGSRCVLRAGHDRADRHETEHGCVCYDPDPPAAPTKGGG